MSELQPRPRAKSAVGWLVGVLLVAVVAGGGYGGYVAWQTFGDRVDLPLLDGDNEPEPEPLVSTVVVGEVVGELDPVKQQKQVDRITEVVDRWLEEAYLGGEYPRTDFSGAFVDFTEDAAELAAGDQKLLTNSRIGADLTKVWATQRDVTIDFLSVKGHPSGATVRVILEFEVTPSGTDPQVSIERVNARLLMVKDGKHWKIFGYDVTRGGL